MRMIGTCGLTISNLPSILNPNFSFVGGVEKQKSQRTELELRNKYF
jgi:hypothetical protein